MTIKELADVAGVSEDTIRRKGKELFPGMHHRGIRTVYTDNQARILIGEVKKKNMVSEVPQSAEILPQSAEVNYEAIGKMIGIAITQALVPVLERLADLPEKKEQAMIAPPEQDFRSMLNQVVNKYALEKTGGDRREAWGVLYEELYYRCHVSIRTRANNSGRSKLDEIERAGLLQSSYLIMVEKMGGYDE